MTTVRGQRHAPAALYPPESPGTHCTGGWVGPRECLDRCGKSRPPLGFDPRTIQPVTSRYTDWATWPTNIPYDLPYWWTHMYGCENLNSRFSFPSVHLFLLQNTVKSMVWILYTTPTLNFALNPIFNACDIVYVVYCPYWLHYALCTSTPGGSMSFHTP